jgi:hypothetical protein
MGKINVVRFKRGFSSTFMAIVFIFWTGTVDAADCLTPVQPIKEGQIASCDGYLFSPSAESQAYKATRIAELQEKENKILEERLKNYQQQSAELAKQLGKKESTEDLVRIGYFTLGAILTGVIAANVNN